MELLEKFNVEEGKEYIYLVMVEYKDKTLLKIGYTKTLNNRMDTYELHNPDIQLLKIREGTRGLETSMHKKFEKYAYPKRKEWFYYNEEIIKEFDTLEENSPIIEKDNLIDIDLLKNKIYNLLKPGPIANLIKIYYDKYEDEINKNGVDRRVLYRLLLDTFSFINRSIKNSILSFDYSEIPSEINPNIDYQLVIPSLINTNDICIDLDEILGKQRLREMPREGCVKLFIKIPSNKNIKLEEKFNMRINTKEENTKSLLNLFHEVKTAGLKETLLDKFMKTENSLYYLNDYISVSIIRDLETDEIKELIPKFNKTIMSFEVMALEILYMEYKNRVTTFLISYQNNVEKPDHYDNSKHDERILSRIIDIFKVGDKYSRSKVKNILRDLYKELGYRRKTAKATDLNCVYVLKNTKVKEGDKWVPGIEILEKRQ